MEKGMFCLFRTKDIHSKGLVGNFNFPDTDSFDVTVNVTLVRNHKKEILIKEGLYKRFYLLICHTEKKISKLSLSAKTYIRCLKHLYFEDQIFIYGNTSFSTNLN